MEERKGGGDSELRGRFERWGKEESKGGGDVELRGRFEK